jgi:hypothetical protein
MFLRYDDVTHIMRPFYMSMNSRYELQYIYPLSSLGFQFEAKCTKCPFTLMGKSFSGYVLRSDEIARV